MYLILLFLIPLYSLQAQEEPSRDYPILDRTHALFTTNLDALANRVDSFFATERADDEFGRSTLRIRSAYEIRENKRGDLNFKYPISLRVPNLERIFKEGVRDFFSSPKIEDESEKKIPKDKVPIRSREDWYFNSDAGVNVSIPPKLILRTRARKNIIYQTWSHRFLEELTYVTQKDGLTEETSFVNDYRINQHLLLRITNSKVWTVLSKRFSTEHGPSIIHQMTPKDAVNYSLFAQTILGEEGPFYLDNYRLSARYRRDIYKKWIFIDSTLGLDFPKHYGFRRNPFANLLLEFLFGS